MSIKDIFEERKNNPIYNTSYPLHPSAWKAYMHDEPLSFKEEKELSLYVHIPFCQHLCSFCEYTRMKCPDEDLQHNYLSILQSDFETFLSNVDKKTIIRGFDIGGGTPTSLSENNFDRLMRMTDLKQMGIHLIEQSERSIEGTFGTVTQSKLKLMTRHNFHRLSLGIQSTNSAILRSQERDYISLTDMKRIMELAYTKGIKKINLDLMYGLPGQELDDLGKDIDALRILHPEQVTLYELRTNMISSKKSLSKEQLHDMYGYLYNRLISMGYHAHYGQNTFSLDTNDFGVSSYLRTRMLSATPYKGFGIGAQSMNSQGISYNIGKNSKNLNSLLDIHKITTYEKGDTYLLPKEELLSKYIAISGYCNELHISVMDRLMKASSIEYFKHELDFLIQTGYITIEEDVIRVTRQGFKYYGAILSLLYTKNQ